MGFENRDYARTDDRSYANPTTRWTIVGWLIAINVAVFIVQCIWTQPSPFGRRVPVINSWLSLDPAAVVKGQIWRLTTYDFMHDRNRVYHILFNMMILFYAGRKLLDRYSEREFFWLYMVSGVLSGMAFVAWQLGFGKTAPAIGASGAVAAIMVVYAVHWPWDRWTIFFVIPMPAVWVAVGTAIFDLYPMLLQLGGQGDRSGVAHVAHIGGMLFGYLYATNQWALEPWIDWVSRLNPLKRGPKLRVHREDPPVAPPPRREDRHAEQLKARMDEILAKITAQGQSSLTEEEQRVLNEASRFFRNRGS